MGFALLSAFCDLFCDVPCPLSGKTLLRHYYSRVSFGKSSSWGARGSQGLFISKEVWHRELLPGPAAALGYRSPVQFKTERGF